MNGVFDNLEPGLVAVCDFRDPWGNTFGLYQVLHEDTAPVLNGSLRQHQTDVEAELARRRTASTSADGSGTVARIRHSVCGWGATPQSLGQSTARRSRDLAFECDYLLALLGR